MNVLGALHYFSVYVLQYFTVFNTAVREAAHVFLPHFDMPYFIDALRSFYQTFKKCSSSFSLIYAVFAGI